MTPINSHKLIKKSFSRIIQTIKEKSQPSSLPVYDIRRSCSEIGVYVTFSESTSGNLPFKRRHFSSPSWPILLYHVNDANETNDSHTHTRTQTRAWRRKRGRWREIPTEWRQIRISSSTSSLLSSRRRWCMMMRRKLKGRRTASSMTRNKVWGRT